MSLTSLIDYRYIYLMERKTKRSRWARLTFQREIKIGIAKKPKSRRSSVNSSIKGNIEILVCRRVLFAERIEKGKLHKMFSDSRYKMKGIKGKTGGGLTEWFFLSSTELFILKIWLWWYSVRHWFFIIFLLLISGFIYFIRNPL